MARFRGIVKGGKGEVSRLGNAKTGIMADVHGWGIGCRAYITVNSAGEDEVCIVLTGGTNNKRAIEDLGTFVARGNTIVKL